MADRTVTTRLRLDVSRFQSGVASAQRSLSGLNRTMAETAGFAQGMRRALEDATRRLPAIEITADSTPAEIAIANVRARLATLADKEIGVDIDASAALIEIAAIQAELEDLEKGAAFDVRADISDALADLQKVLREAQRIDGHQVGIAVEVRGGAFAERLRAQVEAAARSLPAVPITADSSPAERAVDAVRARLEALSGKEIGVNVDATSAMVEIRQLEAELVALANYAPEINVRADAAAALAELRAVDSEVSRLDGRTANVRVHADTSGALIAIAAVTAALAAIPSVASITVGVAGLGAAFSAAAAGAGAFAAAVVPGLSRVNEALQQAENAAGGAGGAVKSAGEKAAEAAAKALRLAEAQDRVKDAAQAVKDAQQRVRDAIADVARAKEDVARVAEDAAARQAAAAARIEAAERAVQEAHRATQRAIEDLTRARERAQERLEDLALATERGALSEERARLNIERARADLARIMADPNASELDRKEADLRLREAELALREIQERNEDLARERAEAERKGIEGSDEVVAARERILQAQQRELDAERNLAEARENAARVAVEGQRRIAEAHERVAQAQRRVGEAQRQLIRAQRDAQRAVERYKLEQLQAAAAASKAGGAAGGAASQMAELSKAERELAERIKDFKEAWEDWQRSLQPDLFPVLVKGMDLIEGNLNKLSPLARAAGRGFSQLLDDAEAALEDDVWDRWIRNLEQHIPGAITGLGRTAGNTFKGIAGLVDAFLPSGQKLIDWLENASGRFADWSASLKGSPEFERFLAYVNENGPKVVEIVGNLVDFVGKLMQAGAGPGSAILDLLVGLSERLANLDPGQIQAIATGIGLIWTAARLGTAVKWVALAALAELITKLPPEAIYGIAGAIATLKAALVVKDAISGWAQLRSEITKTGEAVGDGKKGGAAGKLAGMASMLAVGGPWGIAIGAGITALGLFAEKSAEAEQYVRDLTEAIKADSGALGENARARVVAKLSQDGMLKAAKEAGLNLKDVTDAVLGNSDAWHRLEGQLTRMIDAYQRQASSLENAFAFGPDSPLGRRDALQALLGDLRELRGATSEATEAARLQSEALGENAKAADNARSSMDNLQKSMDTFAAKTDALQATRNMENAYKDAARALEDANGKLDVNRNMTDRQRDAVILAREKFSAYIDAIRTAADGAATLSGKTEDGTRVILEQLPKLAELAGKNREAREQILLLAQAYGIAEQDARKAMRGGKDLKEVLDQLKSKSIRVEADTKPALDTINQLIRLASGKVIRIGVDVRSEAQEFGALASRQKAAGGILAYPGAVETYAAGGMRRPNITNRPVVLYGEGRDREAFIPYDPVFRKRAVGILTQVANDFGLEVVPAGAGGAAGWLEMLQRMGLVEAHAAGGITVSESLSMTSTRATRQITATLTHSTGVISTSLSSTAKTVVAALDSSSMVLSSTLVQTGAKVDESLTRTSTSLSEAWDRAAADTTTALAELTAAETEASAKLVVATTDFSGTVSAQVEALKKQVAELTKALAEAKASAAAKAAASTGSSKAKATIDATLVGKTKTASKSSITETLESRMVEMPVLVSNTVLPIRYGPGGVGYARGGIREPGVAGGPVAIMGEAGHPEAFIPYDPAVRGRAEGLIRQVAADFGMTVMPARVPTYRPSSPAVTYQRPAPAGGPVFDQERFFQRLEAVVASAGVTVNVDTVRETVDIDELAARMAMRKHARG